MKKWNVVMVLALAQFVMVLDSTVMNVSISTIVADLGTSVSALQAAITFYTLTMAALMLIGAKLGARWGLLKAFIIGSIVYGIGSLMTGLSQNIQTLMIGWSVVEGLGAVLVIPAIAALVATNYTGKDRVTAFAIIGGISGAAAAAGPLIGGYVTTYLSWRYVFIAETIIIIAVIMLARSSKASPADKKQVIDIPSALLSASGMILLVFGLLQSKQWGWLTPLATPTFAGHDIAPFGISIVAYLIAAGLGLLKIFYDRQLMLETTGNRALVQVSMLKIAQLRSGLAVLSSQYVITAAIFFVVPIYLQMVLGLNALETGKKLFPLSLALIAFSVIGSKMANTYTAKKIVRSGQYLLILGSGSLFVSMDASLKSIIFSVAMFATGAGLGLLASQLGNINMSAVDASKTSEIGGLQGTMQNLGSSLGTAVIGSILIASLTTGFVGRINNTDLPPQIKNYINESSQSGIQIVSSDSVYAYALERGTSEEEATTLRDTYRNAQVAGLRESVFCVTLIAILSLMLARGIPNRVTK